MDVRNFQRFSNRSFVSAFELIFILKLDYTVKCIFQNTKRPPEQQIFPHNQLNSVNTCSRSEWIKRNVNYAQNINELTDFINFR